MAKILVPQQFYKLADDAPEYQLLDHRGFLQFLGFIKNSPIPDAKTIWLFRDRRAQAGLGSRHAGALYEIVRTTFTLNLKAASYNLQRLVFLKERGLPAFQLENRGPKLDLQSERSG
jgi:hypothetical protein